MVMADKERWKLEAGMDIQRACVALFQNPAPPSIFLSPLSSFRSLRSPSFPQCKDVLLELLDISEGGHYHILLNPELNTPCCGL
jgi:hypothetical protein